MKKGMIITIVVIVVLILVGGFFGFKYILDEKKNKEAIDTEVYLNKETVNSLIAKFNTLILNSGIEDKISEDDILIENNVYYFHITEDISLYVNPIEFTGDPNNDIAQDMAIYYPEESSSQEKAVQYVRLLLKANNERLDNEEIDRLLTKVKEVADRGNDLNENNGLWIGYQEQYGNKFHTIIRQHKD